PILFQTSRPGGTGGPMVVCSTRPQPRRSSGWPWSTTTCAGTIPVFCPKRISSGDSFSSRPQNIGPYQPLRSTRYSSAKSRALKDKSIGKAGGEAVPPRPRLHVSPVLRPGLCEPVREPAASSSQQITEDPDAARRLTEHPRALSGEAAEDALANLWSALQQGRGGAAALDGHGARLHAPALPGCFARRESRREYRRAIVFHPGLRT